MNKKFVMLTMIISVGLYATIALTADSDPYIDSTDLNRVGKGDVDFGIKVVFLPCAKYWTWDVEEDKYTSILIGSSDCDAGDGGHAVGPDEEGECSVTFENANYDNTNWRYESHYSAEFEVDDTTEWSENEKITVITYYQGTPLEGNQ